MDASLVRPQTSVPYLKRIEHAEPGPGEAGSRSRQLLQLLDREFGQPLGSARRLNLRLTHRQLASAAQTTRVTVTRLLQLFQAQGRIEIDADRHLWFPAGGKNSPEA